MNKKNETHNSLINREMFFRFQFTALMATTVDFLITIFFKEGFHVYYSWSVAAGACCGAITAFLINRYWVFNSLEKHPLEQAIRYLAVAAGNVILNTAGTYSITETFNCPYLVSKTIASIVIGFTYSYYFSKRFVFYA